MRASFFPGQIYAHAALVLLAAVLAGAPPAQARSIQVQAAPVELYEGKPYKTRVGELEYLAGFELFSSESSFGGLSGLAVSADGQSLDAVSDRGNYLTARLTHDTEGRLRAVDSWDSTPILTSSGRLARGDQGDAEALVIDADGTRLISFEGHHRIRRYGPANGGSTTGPGEEVPVPPELAGAPFNGGLEAMTVLPDGTILVLTEDYENPDGSVKGWLIRNRRASPIAYATRNGFRPTDAATLPNGDVLVLERKFSVTHMAVRIRRLPLADLASGQTLTGHELAEIGHPLTVDNFEGLAVRRGPKGDTLLYLVSDDNFMPFQRTLLLQFRLSQPEQPNESTSEPEGR